MKIQESELIARALWLLHSSINAGAQWMTEKDTEDVAALDALLDRLPEICRHARIGRAVEAEIARLESKIAADGCLTDKEDETLVEVRGFVAAGLAGEEK